MATSSWMKDIQDRVKRASNDVNVALQPRVAQAKRSLEASIQQIGLKPGPEIFDGDDDLFHALNDLDHLHDSLMAIASAVDSYRMRALDLAKAQATLAMRLSTAAHLPTPPDGADPNAQPEDPTPGVASEHAFANLVQRHVPADQIVVHATLAAAQSFSANAHTRFTLDMSTPMSDLARTLEEAYMSKIIPLKKRYITQKREYLRYSRQAAAADDPLRKQHYDSIAQSAIPNWKASGETLHAEIRSLLSYATSNLSEWTLSVAQAQAETYARIAKALQQPAAQAEDAQNAHPGNL